MVKSPERQLPPSNKRSGTEDVPSTPKKKPFVPSTPATPGSQTTRPGQPAALPFAGLQLPMSRLSIVRAQLPEDDGTSAHDVLQDLSNGLLKVKMTGPQTQRSRATLARCELEEERFMVRDLGERGFDRGDVTATREAVYCAKSQTYVSSFPKGWVNPSTWRDIARAVEAEEARGGRS